MTNKLKRTLSLVLALCMTLGLVTTGALAETEPGSVQNENLEPVCAELKGCTGGAHDEECPLYTAPENKVNEGSNSSKEETPEVPAENQNSIGAEVPDAPVVEDEQVSPSNATLAPQAETVETHIATYVGQIPAKLKGKDGVTADQFGTAYETVKVSVDGTEYTVEVVPEGLVYFIDQIDFNSATVSEPYNAVAALVGSGLLNDKYDQQSNGTWGLVGNAKAKSLSNVDIADKSGTGIYGENGAGHTLVYELTLDSGVYTLTSLHREWWNMSRPMTAVVTVGDVAGKEKTISLSGSSGDQLCQTSFTVEDNGTKVLYTLTNTGSEAPVISWLAVEKTGEYEAPDDSIVASGDCGDQGGNVKWVLTKDGTLTISGSGAMADYGDYAVPWKNYRSATAENAITAIVIGEGVTRIGNNAFYFCQGVTGTVTIPEGVTSLVKTPVKHCTNLKYITISNNVTSISDIGFTDCPNLTTIKLGSKTVDVGRTFVNIPNVILTAESLNTLVEKNSKYIANYFSASNTYYVIGDSVAAETLALLPEGTVIKVCGANAVVDMETLKVTVDGKEVTEWETREDGTQVPVIGPSVLASGHCGSPVLESVMWTLMEDGMLTISGSGAMADYSSSTFLPWKDVKTSITSVVIEPGVTHVGSNAFTYCQNVKTVTIGEGVESIGYNAFKEAICIEEISLPSTLKTIGNSAFAGCRALKELTFPDGLISIGQYACSYCRALEKIVIPASVTSVGKNAFENCDGLKTAVLSVAIAQSMFAKGNYVDDLQLTTISIAPGTKSIGYAAFSNCTKLSAIIIDAETLTALCEGKSTGSNHLPGANLPSSPKFTSTYYVIGDNIPDSVQEKLPNATFAVIGSGASMGVEDTQPSKAGFKFAGWIDSAGNAVESFVSGSGNIYYAKWTCDTHTWNDGKVTLEPTCTTDGTKTYTCMVCGETTTETIDQLGHNTDGTVAHKDATCTEDGVVGGTYCTRCNEGKTAAEAVITKLGHTEVIDAAVEATCTEPGKTEGKHCSVCGEIIQAQETVPAKGHTLTHVDAKAATTEAAGNIEYWHCTACDKYFRDAQATQEITLADTVLDRLTSSVPSGSGSSSVTTYRLTINYVFEDGTQAADAVRRSLSSGSSYSVSSPAVEGYTPDQSVVEGRLSGNLTVTVTYIKDQDVQDPDTPLTGAPVDTVFADIAKDAWYTAAIQHVYDKGWMSGISSTSFAPNDNTTRGMIVTVLHRMENKPGADKCGFTDVADGKYYTYAVNWAASQGVITGYDSGLFGPEDQITREQMVVILYRYAAKKGYDVTARADLSVFSDADQISAYAKEAMSWANAMGLVVGTSETTLSPTDKVTRAQMAMLLTRFENTFEKTVVA